MTRSLVTTRGPVPTPRTYPVLDLWTIVGPNAPGYAKDSAGDRINFDIIGDSGAPSQHAPDSFQSKVTDMLARNAQAAPRHFCFTSAMSSTFMAKANCSQFYEPFGAYLAPFKRHSARQSPGRWSGSAEIQRTTMIQPGVYFRLNTPLVSIIGLYAIVANHGLARRAATLGA